MKKLFILLVSSLILLGCIEKSSKYIRVSRRECNEAMIELAFYKVMLTEVIAKRDHISSTDAGEKIDKILQYYKNRPKIKRFIEEN